MNQENPTNLPFAIQEVPIPFGERLTNAVSQFFYLLALAPICLVTAPISFFRILFTSKKKVMVVQNPAQPPQSNPFEINEEEWKKKHKELFGDDEGEKNN
jgi:hypothetical protein